MRKNFFRGLTIYTLFLVNLAHAVRYGIDWLFGLAAALTLAMLALDIMEVFHHGG